MAKEYPERYESFGGLLRVCLVLFYIYPVYTIFRIAMLYVGAAGWLENATTDSFTTVLLVSYSLFVVLAVWLSGSAVRRIKVRSPESAAKITHNIIFYAVLCGILSGVQLLLIFMLTSGTLNFLSLELSNLLEIIVFVSVLLLYFLWSRRVQCYYCTEEDVVEIPPKSPREAPGETPEKKSPRSKREKASV